MGPHLGDLVDLETRLRPLLRDALAQRGRKEADRERGGAREKRETFLHQQGRRTGPDLRPTLADKDKLLRPTRVLRPERPGRVRGQGAPAPVPRGHVRD